MEFSLFLRFALLFIRALQFYGGAGWAPLSIWACCFLGLLAKMIGLTHPSQFAYLSTINTLYRR